MCSWHIIILEVILVIVLETVLEIILKCIMLEIIGRIVVVGKLRVLERLSITLIGILIIAHGSILHLRSIAVAHVHLRVVAWIILRLVHHGAEVVHCLLTIPGKCVVRWGNFGVGWYAFVAGYIVG